ncbi:transketolase [Rickettsiales bacterium]|nr:transketolase [Rickettsiales bacterium]
MNQEKNNNLVNAIRFLAIDAIQKAKSGHPGMPMGFADVAFILFSKFLRFNPNDAKWPNRDRFILSAGHGSMLLYALYYLVGYKDISLNDIKNFRQLHSKTAGHPEFGELEAIETTTGPLGQGIANAVGMALASKINNAKFGSDIIDNKIYCMVGDGCLMEGISQEAISIAANLKLNNLIALWDNNNISIDGTLDITSSENIPMRFEAAGWQVISIDGHDHAQITDALQKAQNCDKPILIDCKTTIAYGSPNKSGSEKSHGAPLGLEEIELTKKELGWNYGEFEIADDILTKWREIGAKNIDLYDKWQENLKNSDKKEEFNRIYNKILPNLSDKIADFKKEILTEQKSQATRKSSAKILEFFTQEIDILISGSADLTGSVGTKTSTTQSLSSANYTNRYIHYGIREHAMASMMNGMSLYGGLIPLSGTFLVFADYMKPAIRLAAMMQRQIFYIFTHDSIGLGEDGPTHQAVEHLANLRSIPNLNVFRPCDDFETLACYEMALKSTNTPSAFSLTRQNLQFATKEENPDIYKGGYIIYSNDENPDISILATGSEVEIAINAAKKLLEEKNLTSKVVSIPCFEIFDQQSKEYRQKILGNKNNFKIAIEAAIKQGWEKYIGDNGVFIGMDSFGASGKYEDLYQYFGITAENIIKQVKI